MDHFEDEDFGRRRRPRTTTYVGSYRRPGRSRYFNPASDILESIEKTEKTIGQRKTKVRDFENAAAQRKLELMQSLKETETMEDTDAMDSLQAELSKMVDDAYMLDIASFEGDRSAYNKKQSDLNNVLNNLPTMMGLIDAEGEAFKKSVESGSLHAKNLLRDNNEDYVAFVEDASKGGKNIGFRIKGGNVIAQLNGKDIFNANAFIKAKENGVDLVNYAKDYSEQLAAVDKKAFQGLDKYITKESITKIENGTATTEEKQNYKQALDIYTDRLENSELLTPLLNDSTYQTYTEYGTDGNPISNRAWENSDMQRAATKQAMAQRLIEQRFPDLDGSITTSITIKPDKPKGSGSASKKNEEKVDYSTWISKNITDPKIKQTRYHGSPKEVTGMFDIPIAEKRKRVLEKIASFNKTDLVYGDDSKVINALGKTKADPNKLYELIIVPGAGAPNAFEVTVSNKDILNSESLNKLLIDYSIKFNKSSVL